MINKVFKGLFRRQSTCFPKCVEVNGSIVQEYKSLTTRVPTSAINIHSCSVQVQKRADSTKLLPAGVWSYSWQMLTMGIGSKIIEGVKKTLFTVYLHCKDNIWLQTSIIIAMSCRTLPIKSRTKKRQLVLCEQKKVLPVSNFPLDGLLKRQGCWDASSPMNGQYQIELPDQW